MRAARFRATISTDRRLMIQLPKDMPEGPVEVIVLAEARPHDVRPVDDLLAFLDEMDSRGRATSREELDRRLAEERDSWQ